METILEKLPVNEQIKTALRGQPGKFCSVHEMILHYESGQWESFATKAQELGIDEKVVPGIYNDSVKWADKALISGSE